MSTRRLLCVLGTIACVVASLQAADDAGGDVRIGSAIIDDTPAPAAGAAAKIAMKPRDPANDKVMGVLAGGPGKDMALGAAQRPIDNKRCERGFELLDKGDYKGAAAAFRALLLAGNADDINQAEARARQKFNRSLCEVLVSCSVTLKCPDCNGEGILMCPDCNGAGSTLMNITGSTVKSSISEGQIAPLKGVNTAAGVPGRVYNHVMSDTTTREQVVLCAKCHGWGFDVCMHCLGTGIDYSAPVPGERDAFSSYCIRQATEALGQSEGSYGDTPREQLPTLVGGGDKTGANLDDSIKQVWLRDSANRAKSDVVRLWRAEGFYTLALKADPSLLLRATKDLNQELIKIKIRRTSLLSELSERLRYEDFTGGK